ncbi:MAG TPA: hypothetical protein VJH33_03715 [Candidatus Paceibacterota bacterium]
MAYSNIFKTRTVSLLLVCLSLFPLALSADMRVGFPAGNVWLSSYTAVAGEIVELFTALYNASETPFAGTLVFKVDGKQVGEKIFSIEKGATSLESVRWQTTAGQHTVSAHIQSVLLGEGASQTSGSVTLVVSEPPPPSAIQKGVSQAVSVASDAVTSTLPTVLSVAESAQKIIEPYRESAVAYLENFQKKSAQENKKTTSLGEESNLNNTSGFTANTEETPNVLKNTWSALSQAAIAGLLFTFKTPALFYALLLAVMIGGLWSLFQWALKRPL